MWLHSSVGGKSQRDSGITGSTPVEALIFSGLLLSNGLNWKIYRDDHSSLSSFKLRFDTKSATLSDWPIQSFIAL